MADGWKSAGDSPCDAVDWFGGSACEITSHTSERALAGSGLWVCVKRERCVYWGLCIHAVFDK